MSHYNEMYERDRMLANMLGEAEDTKAILKILAFVMMGINESLAGIQDALEGEEE